MCSCYFEVADMSHGDNKADVVDPNCNVNQSDEKMIVLTFKPLEGRVVVL